MTHFDRLKAKNASDKIDQTKSVHLREHLQTEAVKLGVAEVDAKLIQMKYLTLSGAKYDEKIFGKFNLTDNQATTNIKNPGVKEFLQPFVDIKNVFGQGFLDHALYNYTIPYGQLEQFSKELHEIDAALKQGAIRLTEAEEKALLQEMQNNAPGKFVDKKTFLDAQKAETLETTELFGMVATAQNGKEISKEHKQFLKDYREKNLFQHVHDVFGTDPRMDADTAHHLMLGAAGFASQSLGEKIKVATEQKPDKKLNAIDMQAIINKEIPQFQLKFDAFLQSIKTTTTIGNGSLTKFAEVEQFRMPDKALQFFQTCGMDGAKIAFTKKESTAVQEATGTDVAQQVAGFVAALGDVKKATQSEVLAAQGKSLIDSSLSLLEKGHDILTQTIDELKASGLRDKVAELRDLLFGEEGDIFDRLSKFNEMKESKLSEHKTLALNQGFGLIKEVLPTQTGPNHAPHFAGVKTAISEQLFMDAAFATTPQDTGRATVVSKAADAISPTFHAQLLAGTPPATDVIDVTMRAMCGADTATYELFRNDRTTNNFSGAKKRFDDKFGVVATDLQDKAEKQKRDFGKKPNETFARALLATILEDAKAGKGVVKATTNETQAGIDTARAELDALTKGISMRVENNKVYLDGISSTDKVGIKTSGGDPVLYNHDTGFDVGSDGKFTLVKQESTDPLKWSDLVRTEVPVIQPSKVETITQNNKVTGLTLTGLSIEYDLMTKVDYINDTVPTTLDPGPEIKKPATISSSTQYGFDLTKGEPQQVRVKPKAGGLWQTIRKS